MKSHFSKALVVSRHRDRGYVINPSQLNDLRLVTGLILSFLSLLLAPLAAAQDSAAISGTVTDPPGAVVPGPNAPATNPDTGIARAVPRHHPARYRLPPLPLRLPHPHATPPASPPPP